MSDSDSDEQALAVTSLLSKEALEADARANATYREIVTHQKEAAASAQRVSHDEEPASAQRVSHDGELPSGEMPPRLLPKPKISRNKILPIPPWRSEASAQVAAPTPKFSSAASSSSPGQAQGQLEAGQVQGQGEQEHGQEQDASADCPLSVLVPLEWEQVMWYMNRKGKMVYDAKNSPVPLPHPQMEFRGYVECDVDASVSAFFVDKRRKGERGTRLPSKGAGGGGGGEKRRRA